MFVVPYFIKVPIFKSFITILKILRDFKVRVFYSPLLFWPQWLGASSKTPPLFLLYTLGCRDRNLFLVYEGQDED